MCRNFLNGVLIVIAILSFSTITSAASLTTLFAANNSFAGNTFDIEANKQIRITGFDVNLSDQGTSANVGVYYKLGTSVGFTDDAGAWTLLGSDTVISNGPDNPTPLDIGGLTLQPGQLYGIYIFVTDYDTSDVFMLYTNGGPTTYSNDDITLTTYAGQGTPIFSGNDFNYRQWNGTIYYDIYAIPTLSEWGMIIFALLLGGSALWYMRRRVVL